MAGTRVRIAGRIVKVLLPVIYVVPLPVIYVMMPATTVNIQGSATIAERVVLVLVLEISALMSAIVLVPEASS